MKQRYILAYCITALAGTGLHFLYAWVPIPLVALFAPINESPWEHLKLLYWPFLAAAAVMSVGQKRAAGYWGGVFLAILGMAWALLGSYYLASAGFQVQNLIFDVGLYYVVLAMGFYVAGRAKRSQTVERMGSFLLLPVSFLGACLILFSIQAPDFPVFQVPV